MSAITATHVPGAMRPGFAPRTGAARQGVARSRAERPRRSAPVRLTRRGRAVLLTLLALPLAAGIAATAINGGGATATLDDVAVLEFVTVEPGATLWGLATELAPTADPREVIDDIMRFNRLGSADLAAGQQLALPPKYLD